MHRSDTRARYTALETMVTHKAPTLQGEMHPHVGLRAHHPLTTWEDSAMGGVTKPEARALAD